MNSHKSRRLIAGCGYVGYRVARVWLSRGHHTHAITRSSERASRFAEEGIQPLHLDLSQFDSSSTLPEADVVLWSVGFDRSAGIPRERIWLDGLQKLVDALPAPPDRFLYVSSTSVYGTGHGQTVDETSPVNPVSEGGQCCLAAERMLHDILRERFPETHLTVLRLAGIYGPGRLLRRLDDLRKSTPIRANPDHWLNLIHVDDAVRMIDAVSDADDPPGLINVVSSNSCRRRDYYTQLAAIAGAPPPVFAEQNAAGGPENRPRGGNRRVTSSRREQVDVVFQFDDMHAGLEHAVHSPET